MHILNKKKISYIDNKYKCLQKKINKYYPIYFNYNKASGNEEILTFLSLTLSN